MLNTLRHFALKYLPLPLQNLLRKIVRACWPFIAYCAAHGPGPFIRPAARRAKYALLTVLDRTRLLLRYPVVRFKRWRTQTVSASVLRVQQERGDAAALAAISEELQRHFAPIDLHRLRADILLANNRPAEAHAALEPYIQLQRGDWPWAFPYIRALLRCGEIERATDFAKEFVSMNRKSLHTLCDLAHLFRAEGFDEYCVAVFKQIRLYATAFPESAAGGEGFVSPACEYAGYADESEAWDLQFIQMQERETVKKFGPEYRERPVYLGHIATSLGDLASRFDALLKLEQLGLMEPRPTPVYLPPDVRIGNTALVDMLSRHISIHRDHESYSQKRAERPWFAWRDYGKLLLTDGRFIHNTLACALAEKEWVRQGRAPLLALDEQHLAAGRKKLAEFGFGESDWFVALHVRESGYYSEATNPVHNASLHRCADIATFAPAIQWILDQGGWVVRLGDATMAPSPIDHPRVIDYAHADWREDWLDLFFLSAARYLLATNSGPMCLASALGTPVGITNYVPFAMPPLSPRNLFIPKLLRVAVEDRFLTFGEMLRTPFRMANRSHLFRLFEQKLGITLIDNTSDEILDFTKDLHAFCENGSKELFSDYERLQQLFESEGSHYIAQIGPSFVRRHAECMKSSRTSEFAALWDAIGQDWTRVRPHEIHSEAARRLNAGQWREALVLYQAASVGGADDIVTLHGLGTALCHAQQYAEAIDVLSKGMTVAPDSAATVRQLVSALQAEGRYAEAINHYSKFLQQFPNSLTDWLEYGHVLRQFGLIEESIRAYTQPSQIAAQNPALAPGQEGILAASCEYAAQHDTARHWVGAYEKRRDDESASQFRSEPMIVSFGRLGSRIGDVAARFDLLKKGRELGMIALPSDNLVIDTTHDYINTPYLELWRSILPFSSPAQADKISNAPWSQKRDLADIRMRDGRTLYYPLAYSLIEEEWLRQNRKPVIALSQAQIDEGWRQLRAIGMKEGDWFVALHVRESGFFKEAETGPNSDHLHRSATIANYNQAIDWIVAQGGWVIRIGDPSMTPITPRSRLFDYARSDIRSPELDIFLMSQARYLLGTNSGPMAVCTSFGVPCGITNYIPIAFPVCSPRNLMLPKVIFSKRENRFLTLDEMMSEPLGFANRYHVYKRFKDQFGAVLQENTPEEILYFAQDLHHWVDSGFTLRDPRNDTVRRIFESHEGIYVSPFGKSWLDRYEAEGCLGPSSRKPSFGDEWKWSHRNPPIVALRDKPVDLQTLSIPSEIAEIEAGIRTSTEGHLLPILATIKQKPTATELDNLAEALATNGADGLALRALTCAHTLAPDDAGILERLAQAAAFLGRLEIAIAAYRRCIELDSSRYDLRSLVADLCLRAGDFTMALKAYDSLIDRDAASAYHGMGLAARGLGNHTAALTHLKTAVEKAPTSYPTWRELFITARDAGDYDTALGAYAQLKALRPDETDLDYDYVELQHRCTHHDAASQALAQIAMRMQADADYRRSFGDHFKKLAKTIALDETKSPWSEVLQAVEADGTKAETADDHGSALSGDPASAYLDLLRRALTNMTNLEADMRLHKLAAAADKGGIAGLEAVASLMADDPATLKNFARSREQGTWTYNDKAEYLTTTTKTMVGMARLRNIEDSVRAVVTEGILGDLVECGVWRGGASILMRGVLHALGDTTRHVWLCDSFRGLPEADFSYEKSIFGGELDWVAVGETVVRRNFASFGLLDDRVHFVNGWFNETLHRAPIGPIAVLRLDGDYYSSTMDILVALYDKVSSGGFIIVDDYYSVGTCAEAIHTFLNKRKIPMPEIHRIDHHSVYWRKA